MRISGRLAIMASRAYPKELKRRVKRLINYSGINKDVNNYLGLSLLSSLFFTIIILIYFYLSNLINIITVLICLSVLFGTQGVFILYPYLLSAQRANKIDKVLPDFLNLTAANVRSGMTPTAAMRAAAKEDFGILSEEVEDAIALSMGSESYERILSIITGNINSDLLKRIVKLLITGMRTGGNMSSLLEGAAEEVIRISVLKDELITTVRSQMIFIVIVIIAGLPFLLNVSTYFVQTVQDLQVLVNPSQLVPAVQVSDITVEFLRMISYVIIIITSLFASLLVGSVVDNSMIQGLKYFIPILALTLILYFIAGAIIPSVVGSITI